VVQGAYVNVTERTRVSAKITKEEACLVAALSPWSFGALQDNALFDFNMPSLPPVYPQNPDFVSYTEHKLGSASSQIEHGPVEWRASRNYCLLSGDPPTFP